MVLSAAATSAQLGLLLHAAVVMTALKLSAKFSTCDRAMKAATDDSLLPGECHGKVMDDA